MVIETDVTPPQEVLAAVEKGRRPGAPVKHQGLYDAMEDAGYGEWLRIPLSTEEEVQLYRVALHRFVRANATPYKFITRFHRGDEGLSLYLLKIDREAA